MRKKAQTLFAFTLAIELKSGFMQALQALLDELPDLLLLITTSRHIIQLLISQLRCGKVHQRLSTSLFLQVCDHDLLELKLAQFVNHRLLFVTSILWYLYRCH